MLSGEIALKKSLSLLLRGNRAVNFLSSENVYIFVAIISGR